MAAWPLLVPLGLQGHPHQKSALQKVRTYPWAPGALATEYAVQYPAKAVLVAQKKGHLEQRNQRSSPSLPFDGTSTQRNDYQVHSRSMELHGVHTVLLSTSATGKHPDCMCSSRRTQRTGVHSKKRPAQSMALPAMRSTLLKCIAALCACPTSASAVQGLAGAPAARIEQQIQKFPSRTLAGVTTYAAVHTEKHAPRAHGQHHGQLRNKYDALDYRTHGNATYRVCVCHC